MSQQSNQPGVQPLSITKKQWEINGRDLLKNLSKAAFNAIAQNWIGAATDLVEVGAAVSWGSSEAEMAWRLIYESLGQATLALLEDNRDLLVYDDQRLDTDLLALSEQVDLSLGQTELVLDNYFFKNPKQSPVLEAIKPALVQWLGRLVREPQQAGIMAARLPAYFVYALHNEWRQNAKDYAVLKERLDTPFIQAAEREQGWALYGAWLQKKVEEPMFLEAFGLKQVYVPLCAYYRQNKQPSGDKLEDGRMQGREESKRVVVELEGCLNQWLKQGDRTDAIRLISGGPGSGKSSFTKMWAAQLAEEGEVPTLYVPLHLIDATKDLIEAVGEFVAIAELLQHNPLAPETGESRLLLIFDGLDELAMQGKLGAEAAQAFVKEVQTKVNQFNVQKTKLQVLMSGRESSSASQRRYVSEARSNTTFMPLFCARVGTRKLPG